MLSVSPTKQQPTGGILATRSSTSFYSDLEPLTYFGIGHFCPLLRGCPFLDGTAAMGKVVSFVGRLFLS